MRNEIGTLMHAKLLFRHTSSCVHLQRNSGNYVSLDMNLIVGAPTIKINYALGVTCEPLGHTQIYTCTCT